MSTDQEPIHYIVQNLRAVYGVPRKQSIPDPLDELIAAILSQSTSNQNSQRTYENLKRRFPTWDAARRARVSTIENTIKLGGLAHQKALRIKRLLNDIHDQRGSLDLSFLRRVPLHQAKQFLAGLKGVGPITIACTLLFACNRPVFPVDTHILRIGQRTRLLPPKCSDAEAHRIMADVVPREHYYEAHINLIRHGREVCRPREPLCERCCLVDYCEYYSSMC